MNKSKIEMAGRRAMKAMDERRAAKASAEGASGSEASPTPDGRETGGSDIPKALKSECRWPICGCTFDSYCMAACPPKELVSAEASKAGVPLTDEQIDAVAAQLVCVGILPGTWIKKWCEDIGYPFARALESALASRATTAEAGEEAREALAELVRLHDQYRPDPAPHEWSNAWSAADAALSAEQPAPPELARQAQDAARYRWLRANTGDQIPYRGWWQIAGSAGAVPERLDAAIDAALATPVLPSEQPTYCAVHQHYKWCEHNGGEPGPNGYTAPVHQITPSSPPSSTVSTSTIGASGASRGEHG